MTLNGVSEMAQKLYVKVIHSLPGRVRLKLSIPPKKISELQKTVKAHPGIFEVRFSKHTNTLLVKFDRSETSQEELIIRVAVFLSLENDLQPVQAYSDTEVSEISNSAFLAGFLILTSVLSRILPQFTKFRSMVDWSAGIGTAYAIVDHGYEEFKERGNFDPEVLSVIYLLTSFSQGKFLPATILSWIASFGRHLIKFSSKNVEIYPQRISDSSSDKHNYEVVVHPLNQMPGKKMIFRFLPMIIMNLAMGDPRQIQGTLMEEIRKVSTDHGDILEGFGKFKNGIPIRIQYSKN